MRYNCVGLVNLSFPSIDSEGKKTTKLYHPISEKSQKHLMKTSSSISIMSACGCCWHLPIQLVDSHQSLLLRKVTNLSLTHPSSGTYFQKLLGNYSVFHYQMYLESVKMLKKKLGRKLP